MTLVGTTIPSVKRALVDRIENRLGGSAAISYDRPLDASGHESDNGDPASIYLDATVTNTIDVPVMTGGPLWFDERYTISVVIQARSDGADQDVEWCDNTVAELAHGVIGAIAQDPLLSLTDTDELQRFSAVVSGGEFFGSSIGDSDSSVGTRYVVRVDVHARLKLT